MVRVICTDEYAHPSSKKLINQWFASGYNIRIRKN